MAAPGMAIVGAGEAGARAALALREAGYDSAVTLIGAELHRPYERPPLSKAALTGPEPPAPTTILSEARAREADIACLVDTCVTAIRRAEHRIELSDGRELAYERLLIATGARPRRLTVPGAEHAVYLRTFDDALALRARLQPGARLAVIGGGFIGLEVAASAVQRGAQVTVVEAAPRLLARGVPLEIAERMHGLQVRAGVAIHLNARIERIDAAGSGYEIVLADGARIASNLVLAGIGAVPETALAEAAGLAIDNGVAVDQTLRTSDPDIFAAGDCCSFPCLHYGGRRIRLEAWRNAQDQGAAAARAMLGSEEPYAAVPWFWSDQYDETLQIAGLPDESRRVVVRESGAARFFFHLADNGRLVAASSVGPNTAIARDMRLAEMMIAKHAAPDPRALADPAVGLKALLRGA